MDDLKVELYQLYVSELPGSTASKLSKTRVVCKSIAFVLTAINQTQKENQEILQGHKAQAPGTAAQENMCCALPAQHVWGEFENHTAATKGMVVTTVKYMVKIWPLWYQQKTNWLEKKKKGWRASFKLKQKDDKEQQKQDKNIKLLRKGKNINLELCSVRM